MLRFPPLALYLEGGKDQTVLPMGCWGGGCSEAREVPILLAVGVMAAGLDGKHSYEHGGW